MKRLVLLIISLATLFSLCSCEAKTVEITRYEEQPLLIGGGVITGNIDLEDLYYFCQYYGDRFTDLTYLPQEGKFTAADGESFIVEVENCGLSFFPPFIPRVYAEIKVFSESREPIAEGIVVSHAPLSGEQADKKIEETLSDESIRKYWDASKIRSDEFIEARKGAEDK